MKSVFFAAALGDLWGRQLDPTVTAATLPAAVEMLPDAEELDLHDQDRDGAFLAVLLAQPALRNTRVLNLSGNPLGPEGARAIAGSAQLAALADLDLSNTGLGDEGARALGEATLPALRTLRLDQCGIGDAGARGLTELDTLRHVATLSMAGTADLWDEHGKRPFLGPKGFSALVGAPMEALVELRVPLNAVGDGGARALAQARQLGALKVVDLRANQIGDSGAQALLDAPQLAEIQELDLRDNPISEAMKVALRGRFQDRVQL